MRAVALGVAAALALVAPAAAGAAPTRLSTEGSGPHLPDIAGTNIVYIASGADGGDEIRLLTTSGDRVLREFGPAPEDDDEGNYSRSVLFEASSGVLATTQIDTFVGKSLEPDYTYRFEYGPLTGSATRLTECGGSIASAVDGNRIALTRCVGNDTRVDVIDVTTGAVLASFEKARIADIAGDRVAFYRGTDVVVAELPSGAELYSVAAPRSSARVQADAKLAVTGDPGQTSCAALAWYSPAEPTAHAIPGCVVSGSLRFAGDRLLFEDRDGANPVRLVVSDLAGAKRALAGETLGYDLDAGRAVYACRNGLFSDDLAEPLNPAACSNAIEEEEEDPPREVRGCHPDDPTARQVGSRRCRVDIRGRTAPVDSRAG